MKRRRAQLSGEDEVARQFVKWRGDPCGYGKAMFGAHLWQGQRDMLNAVRDHPRTGIPGCHGAGKGFAASVLAWWWMTCFAPAKVIVISAGGRQAERVVGAEIRTRYAELARKFSPDEMKFMGLDREPSASEWKRDDESFMLFFSTRADDANEHATKATGWHSPNLLIVLDEAGGIAKPIWSAIQGNLAGSHRHLCAIGNPNDPSSEFARFCRRPDVKTVRLDAYDHPNVRERRAVLPYGPTVEWVEEMRRLWGADSNSFMWKVRGQFPGASSDGLISHEDVSAALERVPRADCVHSPAMLSVGADIARFGDDRTFIVCLCNGCGATLDVEIRHGQDLMSTVGLIVAVAVRRGLSQRMAKRICVDDVGVGSGCVDRLRELGWNVRGINAGSKPLSETSEEKFFNRRAEMYWRLRSWLRERASLATLDREHADTLRDELTSVRYSHTSDSRVKIEAKDEAKRRIGRSPDFADSLCLAVAGLPGKAVISRGSAKPAGRVLDKYAERDKFDEALQRGEPWAIREHVESGYVPPRNSDHRRVFEDWS